MKKVVRAKESDLKRIANKVIRESERVYGHEKIKSLWNDLKDDEYVSLDDYSGDLSGTIVKKTEYIIKMLNSAIREQNWAKVENTISFIRTQM